jgi:hypothetical protein
MALPYVSPTSESMRPAPACVNTTRCTVLHNSAARRMLDVEVMNGW